MIKYAWYYLPTGKKRHVVRQTELAAFPQQNAVCGTMVLAFLPSRARWQNDSEGLEAREECASCAKTLEVENEAMRIAAHNKAADEVFRRIQAAQEMEQS